MFDNELNQSQLAEKLNINKSIITRIMQEKYNISVDNLEEYCNKLGIGIEIMVKKDKYIAIS